MFSIKADDRSVMIGEFHETKKPRMTQQKFIERQKTVLNRIINRPTCETKMKRAHESLRDERGVLGICENLFLHIFY